MDLTGNLHLREPGVATGTAGDYKVTMNLPDRITVNPRQCGGRPCVRGMRNRVTDVLDLLEA